MSNNEYYKLLRDPRWQRLRLRVMERDGFKCLSCGESKVELQVHHLVYHPGDPWDAPMDELETLCHDCHEARTEYNRKMRLVPTSLVLGKHAYIARMSAGLKLTEDGVSFKLPTGTYDIDWSDLGTMSKVQGWLDHLKHKAWFTRNLCNEFITAVTMRMK